MKMIHFTILLQSQTQKNEEWYIVLLHNFAGKIPPISKFKILPILFFEEVMQNYNLNFSIYKIKNLFIILNVPCQDKIPIKSFCCHLQ